MTTLTLVGEITTLANLSGPYAITHDGTNYIAVGYDSTIGEARAAYSSDLATWTYVTLARNAGVLATPTAIVAAAGRIFAYQPNGSSAVHTSTDGGATWSLVHAGLSARFFRYGGGRWVSYFDGILKYSTDGGETWSDANTDGSWTMSRTRRVAYGTDGNWYGVATNSSVGDVLFGGANATDWTKTFSLTSTPKQNIVACSAGLNIMASGDGRWTDDYTVDWQLRTNTLNGTAFPNDNGYSSAQFSAGVLMARSKSGGIHLYETLDLVNMTELLDFTDPVDHSWLSLCFANNKVFLVSQFDSANLKITVYDAEFDYELVVDEADADEEMDDTPPGDVEEALDDFTTSTEQFSFEIDPHLIDTATDTLGSDALEWGSDPTLTDEAGGDELAEFISHSLVERVDTATASDVIVITADAEADEDAQADEELTAHSDTTLEDAASSDELMEWGGVATVEMSEAADASDEFVAGTTVDLLDEGTGEESVVTAFEADLADEATGDELVDVDFGSDELLSDAATTTEELLALIDANALLLDDAQGGETLVARNPAAIAWVMTLESAAPYWYSNFPFSQIVQSGERTFAVGPEGFYELTGNDDAGDHIDASLQYGFTDFGGYDRRGAPAHNPYKKRVENFVFGYNATAPLKVKVETKEQGVFEYTMLERSANAPTGFRIKPGKGLNARFWRLQFANTDGGDFSIYDIEADVVQSNRRI
jgi:hypothetical protein